MDGPVVASLISSSVAVLVAVGSAIRSDLQRASDRRYERRRMFLIDAQEAALAFRNGLREYGEVLKRTLSEPSAHLGAEAQRRAVAVAGGRLEIAGSRIDDATVVSALAEWEQLARETLLGVSLGNTPSEEEAFSQLNRLVGAALRSARGLGRR
jgi:hypothetical protein